MADDLTPQNQPDRGAPGRGEAVPAPAVRRLSLYLRELESFLRRDRHTISSKQLGDALNLTDAQVRKDLAYFGQFGHPGIGYRVDELVTRIRCILGTDRIWNVLLVGAGNLGHALLSYRGFGKKGFQIVAVFDSDPRKVGDRLGAPPQLVVQGMEQLAQTVADQNIQLGIIAVPADVAQDVADALVKVGIKGILNFAPTSLNVPEGVPVASVDLAVHLEQLAFRVSANQLATPRWSTNAAP